MSNDQLREWLLHEHSLEYVYIYLPAQLALDGYLLHRPSKFLQILLLNPQSLI